MRNFFNFIKNSPTPYHTAETVRRRLIREGYTELYETDRWELEEGKGYFTVRGGTALVAFRTKSAPKGFMIVASHTDSPAFKVKSPLEKSGTYTLIPTEKYGGMIMYSWFDRPLAVGGRLVVKTEEGIRSTLVNSDAGICVIPSIAPHLNRNVNDGYKFNPAKDTVPLAGLNTESCALLETLCQKSGIDRAAVLSHDLFVYSAQEPTTVGIGGELILSPRLDDLECVYASLEGFLTGDSAQSVPVLALFDNEEVGSATTTGADSSFLSDVLLRIADSRENLVAMLPSSLAVSADNAHACHPNAPELSDKDNAPVLGGGVVVKYNANKRYSTDGVSSAIFLEICNRAGVKTQSYYNRADMPGGSTLGAILATQLAVPTVDIGLAQLAMHSAVETASKTDLDEMCRALSAFYNTALTARGYSVKIN